MATSIHAGCHPRGTRGRGCAQPCPGGLPAPSTHGRAGEKVQGPVPGWVTLPVRSGSAMPPCLHPPPPPRLPPLPRTHKLLTSFSPASSSCRSDIWRLPGKRGFCVGKQELGKAFGGSPCSGHGSGSTKVARLAGGFSARDRDGSSHVPRVM